MAENLHPLAPHFLPFFLPDADGGDRLMTTMLVALIVGGVALGSFYMRLHSLPERIAHGNDRMQFEIVAILALLALFTHNNLFWVAALLLAFIRLPDFATPLASIAASLRAMAPPAATAETRGAATAGAEPSSPGEPPSGGSPESAVQSWPLSETEGAAPATGSGATEAKAAKPDAAQPTGPDAKTDGRN